MTCSGHPHHPSQELTMLIKKSTIKNNTMFPQYSWVGEFSLLNEEQKEIHLLSAHLDKLWMSHCYTTQNQRDRIDLTERLQSEIPQRSWQEPQEKHTRLTDHIAIRAIPYTALCTSDSGLIEDVNIYVALDF